ncbi:hypothetical protein EMEDMD4_440083 [Sinorhizobium medicae]|uniref:Uncharacterized protein n=1 Tax=Sinorhizobium medicae TaxID=110321 RepID=A0A508WZ53_9HYPH|nr:hypothetical protein EMEDMD4_440083 [Sinorhizobium medicae]
MLDLPAVGCFPFRKRSKWETGCWQLLGSGRRVPDMVLSIDRMGIVTAVDLRGGRHAHKRLLPLGICAARLLPS